MKDNIEVVKSNIYSMYEWICSIEDQCRSFKKALKDLECNVVNSERITKDDLKDIFFKILEEDKNV